MYEMRPGPNLPGSTVVWHVTAKQTAIGLCGQQLRDRMHASQAEQARHCPACMAAFAQLVATVPPVKTP
ncbi:hypothetical protein AB0D34_46960 [Streptomyces sp. NPDC048420]|uniref:hypothetical protein n=1 Tax=Streptomyces sp. NPDC048420 TaxID=3155755 RepID=UPI003417BCFD